jgi:hypothetical protein
MTALGAFLDFAVRLEQRHGCYLRAEPFGGELAALRLCNANRRWDRTTLHVITEILSKLEGPQLLLHLAVMRAGPNEPRRYDALVQHIGGDFTEAGLRVSLAAYAERNRHEERSHWPPSYRRPLGVAGPDKRAAVLHGYAQGAAAAWRAIVSAGLTRKGRSERVFRAVLQWLGGAAEFTAWQICLDLGYVRSGWYYDEDEHVLLGGGEGQGARGGLTMVVGPCADVRARLCELRDHLQGRMQMKVTLQTVEGLLCEFRKYRNGAREYRGAGRADESYKRAYAAAQRYLSPAAPPEPDAAYELPSLTDNIVAILHAEWHDADSQALTPEERRRQVLAHPNARTRPQDEIGCTFWPWAFNEY